jgi:hypothetical protein
MKKTLIIVSVIGLIGVGIGVYLNISKNKVFENDFDAIVNLSKNKGYDVFEDVSPREMDIMRKNYLRKFNRKSHNEFVELLSKPKNSLTASDKTKIDAYTNNVLQGLA